MASKQKDKLKPWFFSKLMYKKTNRQGTVNTGSAPPISVSVQPAPTIPPVVRAEQNSSLVLNHVSDGVPQESKSILGLWSEAYQDLKAQQSELVNKYEARLSNDPLMILSPISGLLGIQVSAQDQMATFLRKKMSEVEGKAWKLKFGDKEFRVKDLAEPVVGIIKWTEKYVDGAISANPYASVAWAGISLLLPLF